MLEAISVGTAGKIARFAPLALCFALVAGCRGVSSSAANDAGLMKLAVVFDDSMGQASLGMEAKRGAMMAVEEARSSDFRAVYCGAS